MATSYRQRAEKENAANRASSETGRDIAADYPGPPDDTTIRDGCERDLRLFLETYFPQAFPLAWSDDHLRIIAKLERVILDGGLLAVAMPRGSGKTTIVERAALWAVLYAHRCFVVIVGATETAAEHMLMRLKTELELNDALYRDFPEVCYPIRRLENNARRCVGQLFNGEQTRPTWSSKRIVLPTMPGSAASGTAIHATGLTGALRGLSHGLADGTVTRPDLALLDDPQTRESAMSPQQSARRAEILNGDVLGMAGPGKSIATVATMTVIADGDLADRTLDRETSPQWQGERTQLMRSMPSNTKLWEQYGDIRSNEYRDGGDGSKATAFYVENREAMDKGAEPSWPERFNPDEVSAVQHAMNLWLRNPAAFAAEYQNEPLRDTTAEASVMDPDAIMAKVNGYDRRTVPLGAEYVTAHVDVHDNLLFYGVVAWSARFDGWVLDYGAYPEQPQRYYTLREAKKTLGTMHPEGGKEASIFAGLKALTDRLCKMEWQREDGSAMRITRLLIDSGYASEAVYMAVRQSHHAGILMPARGLGIGASNKPLSEYRRSKGDLFGERWYVPAVDGRRAIRHVRHDANFWKTFIHTRLAVPAGDAGALTLWGKNPAEHRLFADHLTAEYPVRTSGHGRVVDEWKLRPGRDNHILDNLVGAAVGASMVGASVSKGIAGVEPVKQRRRKRRGVVAYF